jgi:hypothetical protein
MSVSMLEDLAIWVLAFTIWALIFLYVPGLWCRIGLHRWNMPGGHCDDCGKCDEFFGPHNHKRKKK